MKRLRQLYLLQSLSLLSSGVTVAPAAIPVRQDRPNIVFILADDLGWRDIGASGSLWHQTPHLDQLAREGLRHEQAYAPAPICSASRSAILTGRSPARLHFEFVTKLPDAKVEGNHVLRNPAYPLNLPLSEITLGEMLGSVGYRTGFYGKWHVSAHNGGYLNWSTTHGPLQQGFEEGDQEFGSHPYGDATRSPAESGALPDRDYGSDSLTDQAVGFMRRHRNERFFLYLSHYYVHTPIGSRAQWSVEANRAELPSSADPERATYAAMVETLDALVGRVMRELDDLGLAENTLVIFTSDNGGHPQYAANGPARGSKWNVYEGGLRVPFIVRWPGRVAAGTEDATPMSGTDLFPTLAAVAGVTPAADIPLDGVNLLPLWENLNSIVRSEPLVWHFPFYHPETNFDEALPAIGINDFAVSQTYPQSAIRLGNDKLVHFYEDDRDELYDLAADPGEQRDLCRDRPERAWELRQALDGYLREVDARVPTSI